MSINTSDFQYKSLSDGTIEITGYIGTSESITIPSSIDGKNVTSIGKAAFYQKDSLTSVEIPNTVTKIGEGAFSQCTNLTSIIIGDKVEVIETYAFDRTAIQNITIPASVKEIGEYIFYDCLNIENITVENNNTQFCDQNGVLFDKNKTKLIFYPIAKKGTTYTIPSTVTTIGELCFRKSIYLEEIKVPDSVTELENFAFSLLPKLKTITLPSSITTMGYELFQECNNLISATISCNVEKLPGRLFFSCENLQTLDLSQSTAKEFEWWSICYCDKLSNVILPRNLERLNDYTFEICDSLISLEIPSTIKRIQKNFCYKCKNFNYDTIKTNLISDGDGGWLEGINITIEGQQYYDKALEAIEETNKQRIANGKEALTIDETLMKLAMERAIEISAYFDHTRPNDTDFSSILRANGIQYTTSGENILGGYTTAVSAIQGWMESPGHKANILNGDFKSIGMGCFVTNDTYYWVQIFTSNQGTGTVTAEVKDATQKQVVFTDFISDITLRIPSKYGYSSNMFDIGDIVDATVSFTNQEWTFAKLILKNTDLVWESLTPSVVTVNENGQIKIVGTGTGKIRVSLGDITKEYELGVYIPIESIEIPKKLEMTVGETIEISVVFNPYNTNYGKNIKWSTSNSFFVGVQTLDKTKETGKIIARNAGTAIITAESINGKTATCEVTVKMPTIKGDVNKDGRIDSVDASLVLNYNVQDKALTAEQIVIADVNEDGRVNSKDSSLILQMNVGLITEFPTKN